MEPTIAVIHPDGSLEFVEARPSVYDALRAAVGEPGFDAVRLPREPTMCGYVNDEGLVSDPPMERNVIGGALLWTLGASETPYAGPVVITGFDRDALPVECVGLRPEQIAMIRAMHSSITEQLASVDPPADLARFAEMVRTALAGPMLVIPAGTLSPGDRIHIGPETAAMIGAAEARGWAAAAALARQITTPGTQPWRTFIDWVWTNYDREHREGTELIHWVAAYLEAHAPGAGQ